MNKVSVRWLSRY